MNIIPIQTNTAEGRAALSHTLRMMGTAGVERQQAEAGVRLAWRAYRRSQYMRAFGPGMRDHVRLAIIRLRLARVCG